VVDVIIPSKILPIPVKKTEVAAPAGEPIKEKVKMTRFTSNIKVVENPVTEQSIPDLKDLENSVIGPQNKDGPGTVAQGVSTGAAQTGEPGGIAIADETIYTTEFLEVYPEFNGGMKAWAKFIQRNLNYPDMAQDQGIQGKVFISFVIEKDGSVSDVTLIRGIGAGCDEEAIRVIKKSPKWKPGRQNNQNVRVRYQMPLSFTLSL
uniref:energy transducer TonB n=1 Tax=Pedobacter sp. TaxID=1411316 RepID=UPI003D7FCE16